MPPKRDANAGVEPIAGFDAKETKWLAAAFISSIGSDKYDYDLMASLTGNTAGTLKKLYPVIKRKAMEAQPSFATFLGGSSNGENRTSSAKQARVLKRKADETAGGSDPDSKKAKIPETSNNGDEGDEGYDSEGAKPKKRAPKKAAPKKDKATNRKKGCQDSGENSPDGADDLGMYTQMVAIEL
ncbi:hypothetical protein CC78DRAFT_207832 [Lojkania enalia]|uniref:Uncharacterized protein n=1 Tax=Lojkania enalia TaxID=147567 RepID=A0A9P4KCC8_9PLEO|nr:hypothetical protein CC78DRAFT_207832 [Didymosphaeria enalia]